MTTLEAERPQAPQDDDLAGPVTQAGPEPVTGAAVLDEARAFLARFASWPSEAALTAATLWAAHCHATDGDRVLVFGSTPRLAILSDEPGCGKTRVLELLELLIPRPVRCSNPTAPGLTRVINDSRATILCDEIDRLFGKGKGKQDVQAVLNAGYRRGSSVLTAAGATATFGPVGLAGMGATFSTSPDLLPTYQRSVVIWMRKPDPGAMPEDFRDRLHAPVGQAIRDAMGEWAHSQALSLYGTWPDLPDGIHGRDADIWEPLLSVADVAGGPWPEMARAACCEIALGAGGNPSAIPPGARLLADLAVIWTGDKLPTSVIVERLLALPGGIWARMWPDPVSGAREMAALLRAYKVSPRKVWHGGKALQGYVRGDFLALWPAPSDTPEPSGADDSFRPSAYPAHAITA